LGGPSRKLLDERDGNKKETKEKRESNPKRSLVKENREVVGIVWSWRQLNTFIKKIPVFPGQSA